MAYVCIVKQDIQEQDYDAADSLAGAKLMEKLMNLGPAAQALFRHNLMHDFRIANFEGTNMGSILRDPTSFFPHPSGFYSTGICNGVSNDFYRQNKGRIDTIYMDIAQAFNGQFGYPLREENAKVYAAKLSRIWGGGVGLLDGARSLHVHGDRPTLNVCLKRHEKPDRGYRVDGYLVMSAD